MSQDLPDGVELPKAIQAILTAANDCNAVGNWQAANELLDALAVVRRLADREKQAARVPEGWKLVPVETTPEMIQVAIERGAAGEYNERIWDAMLAAAPTTEPSKAEQADAPSLQPATEEDMQVYRGIADRYFKDTQPPASPEQVGAPRWPNVETAMEDPLFQRARALMGTENWFQDNALRNVINYVLGKQNEAVAGNGEIDPLTSADVIHDAGGVGQEGRHGKNQCDQHRSGETGADRAHDKGAGRRDGVHGACDVSEKVAATQPPASPEQAVCGLCGSTEPFTGTCGGGRDNPIALCFVGTQPPASPEQADAPDSYDAIWNALQRIDSVAASLPTYTVDHAGGIEAFAQNIVDAITRLAQPLASNAGERPVLAYLLTNEDIGYWKVFRERQAVCGAMDEMERSGFLDNSLTPLVAALATKPQAGDVAQDKEHAENYRWLRKALSDRSKNGVSHHICSIAEGQPDELDKAIRAARTRGEGGGK